MNPMNDSKLQELARRYLAQELNNNPAEQNQQADEELEEFELYLLSHPEVLEELEMDLVLKTHLPDAIEQVQKEETVEQLNTRFDWKQFWYVPAFSSIATAALMLILLLPMTEGPGPGEPNVSEVAAEPVAHIINLHVLRTSNAAAPEIVLTELKGKTALVMQPGPKATGPFDVELQLKSAGAENIKIKNVPRTNNRRVMITLPVSALNRGEYEIVLRDQKTNESKVFPLVVN